MSKHTPGPWKVSTKANAIVSCHNEGLLFGNSEDEEKYYGGYLIAESVSPCNAHQIAAAPDLLEALENLENDGGNTIPPSAWSLVQAALAKARGEQ